MNDVAEGLKGLGLVTQTQLDAAERAPGVSLCARLAAVGVAEDAVLAGMSKLTGIPLLPTRLPKLAPAGIPGIHSGSLRDARVAPLGAADGVLHIAVADPADAERLARLELGEHRIYLAGEERILAVLDAVGDALDDGDDDGDLAPGDATMDDAPMPGRMDARALRPAPRVDDEAAPPASPDAPPRRGRALPAALAVGALLVVGGGAAFALSSGNATAGPAAGDAPAAVVADDPLTARQKLALAAAMKKLDAGQHDAAVLAFTAAIDVDPSSTTALEALVGRARARAATLDVGGAKADLRRALNGLPAQHPARAGAEDELKRLP